MKSTLRSVVLLCFFLAWGMATCLGQAYSWDTIAGSPGLSGSADGTNSTARFYTPSCLAVDTNGIIYVADNFNCTIRKLQPSGTDWVVTTIAGVARSIGSTDGTNNDARFNKPKGIVVGPGGTLFVADHSNQTIRKIAPQGNDYVVSTIAGIVGSPGSQDGATGEATFANPTGIGLDSQGNLYVGDSANKIIRQISPYPETWLTATIAGEFPFGGFADGYGVDAEFELPMCLALDREDKVYVSDYGNNAIRLITLTELGWLTTTIAGNTNAGSLDGAGTVAMFRDPNGIAVDASGNLYVADQGNHTIRKISPAGADWIVSTIGGMAGTSGSADGVGIEARFKKPFGITVDAAGVLYVADFSNHTIRRGKPVAGSPTIQLISSNGQFFLAWPDTATNYEMETSGTLSPDASWQVITEGITVLGNNFTLPMVPSGSAGFYRLRQK